jgi:hypothetical protein
MGLLDKQDVALLSFFGSISIFWLVIGFATLYGITYAKEVLIGSAFAMSGLFILIISITLYNAYKYHDLR